MYAGAEAAGLAGASARRPASTDVERWRLALQGLLARHARRHRRSSRSTSGRRSRSSPRSRSGWPRPRSGRRATTIRVALTAPRIAASPTGWRGSTRRTSRRTSISLALPRPPIRRRVSAYLRTVDPDARIALLAGRRRRSARRPRRAQSDRQPARDGRHRRRHRARGAHPASLAPALRALAPLAPLLAGDITRARRAGAGLTLSRRRPRRHRARSGIACCSTTARSRPTSSTGATGAETPLDVALTLPVEGAPGVLPPGRRREAAARPTTRGTPKPAASARACR